MAEYVEQRMEEMIPEVEELERVCLLETHEVKELIRRRKHFEYKIQKRNKRKEDFLSYIQYERNLKSLIDIRRANIRYYHKKDVIEESIKKRIHRMFIILCTRWQSDRKLWLSHIDWLKEINWKDSVSKIYMSLLQVHNSDPKLWIAAAKFEFEEGSAENGRQIMLRGLRFHPHSRLLHREYVKFELLYVEKLITRKKVLKIEEDDTPENNKKDKGPGDEDAETDEKDMKVDDKILNCELVNLVVQSALESIAEPEFAVSLLMVTRMFPFSKSVQQNIFNILQQKFSSHPVTVDTRARMILEKEGQAKDLIGECISVYRDAFTDSPSAQLIHLALETLKGLAKCSSTCSVLILRFVLEILEIGHSKDYLNAEEYLFYCQLLDVDGEDEKFSSIMSRAVNKFPQNFQLWRIKLESAVRSTYSKPQSENRDFAFTKVMTEACGALSDEDRVQFWNTFVEIMNRHGKSTEAYEYLEDEANKQQHGFLRVLFLDKAYEKGIQTARDVYARFHLLPPFCKELHDNMVMYELEQKKVDKPRVREIYQVLSSQFGSENIQVWLEWIRWEERSGRVLDVPNIVCRAEANLKSDLVNKFTTLRETQV